jgi:hypothetical protein
MKNPYHIKLWPQRFHYLFDDKDPDTRSTIILTSHDTLVSRYLRQKEVLKQEGIPLDDGEEHLNEDGTTMWQIPPVYKKTQIGRLRGKVGIAAVDQAHRLKDKSNGALESL